jgi:hypothetical protein
MHRLLHTSSQQQRSRRKQPQLLAQGELQLQCNEQQALVQVRVGLGCKESVLLCLSKGNKLVPLPAVVDGDRWQSWGRGWQWQEEECTNNTCKRGEYMWFELTCIWTACPSYLQLLWRLVPR